MEPNTPTPTSTPNGSDKAVITPNPSVAAAAAVVSSAASSASGSSTNATSAAAKTTMEDAKAAAQRVGTSLRTELTNLKGDLDILMGRASNLSDEELRAAHAQLMAKFSSMKTAAKGMADEATRQFNRGVETTSTYVKDKPMQSVAVAVGAGLLLGLLVKRR